jgi:16S rRNA pseudouridine516 synthase
MQSHRSRLDRFIQKKCAIKRQDVRYLLAQKRIHIDGKPASDMHAVVEQFTHVTLDGQVLQDQQAYYFALNKPQGMVSATRDAKHSCAIACIDHPAKDELHIAGRLDFNSTGLLLLSNDGQWTRRISLPENKLVKCYQVELEKPLSDDYIHAFATGIYFAFENITTQAAKLHIIDDYHAEVHLTEGRYHQVKRMFGHFDNKVLSLHRSAVGNLQLDAGLKAGQFCQLDNDEAWSLFPTLPHPLKIL